MEAIGLIAAMPQESEALLRLVQPWKRIAIRSLQGYSFPIAGHDCTLVTSGMGTRRAREAAKSLVEYASLQVLISFGIAGAVETDLEIGDVVLPSTFCQLTQGVVGQLEPLATWQEPAREAMAQALAGRGAQLYAGVAVTTSGLQSFEYKASEMRHPVLEMETAGIAQVAGEKGLPLLSLRAISDGPRDPIPVDLGEVMDEDANLLPGRLLQAILHNPKIITQSGRMRRNTRTAADCAAIALVAALSRTDFL